MGYLSSSKWFMNDEYIYDENIISQDVPNPNCIQYKNVFLHVLSISDII